MRAPRAPRLQRLQFDRPAGEDLVDRAAAKNPRKKKKKTSTTAGYAAGSRTTRPHSQSGWVPPPRDAKRFGADEFPRTGGKADLSAPQGRHHRRGGDKEYEGRHRGYQPKHATRGHRRD